MIEHKTVHMSLCISGALNNWTPRQFNQRFDGCVTRDDGTPMSAEEFRVELENLYAQGVRVVPIGNGCDGFDPINGCPGHPAPASSEIAPAGEKE